MSVLCVVTRSAPSSWTCTSARATQPPPETSVAPPGRTTVTVSVGAGACCAVAKAGECSYRHDPYQYSHGRQTPSPPGSADAEPILHGCTLLRVAEKAHRSVSSTSGAGHRPERVKQDGEPTVALAMSGRSPRSTTTRSSGMFRLAVLAGPKYHEPSRWPLQNRRTRRAPMPRSQVPSRRCTFCGGSGRRR